MKNEFIYLTYYQAMAFLVEIEEIKKRNPSFNDGISADYGKYVVDRTTEIAMTYPAIKLKILPNASKYRVSKSLFEYLTRLTAIDVFDKETMEKYIKIVTEIEKEVCDNLDEEFKKSEIKIFKKIR